MKRRQFIQSSALAATAVAMGGPAMAMEEEPGRPHVRQFRPLGRTDMKMSDISFGAGRLPAASLILRAIDRGINYFDTAPDYGPSEDHIGKALQRFSHRDRIHIASKFCHPIGYQAGKSHLQLGSSVEDYVTSVENSLQRLGTDYLDVVFVHAIGEKNDLDAEGRRLLDENMLEAAARLKKAGKMRYLAVSSHGPHNMETLVEKAVDSGHFDLIMVAFNFMKFPGVPQVIRKAAAKGVGVIAMKTLAGARESGAELEPGQFEHAAFKWVLKHPEVNGLVVTFKSAQDLDRYLPASGQAFNGADQKALNHYAALHGADYCRTGCGDCSGSCPHDVDIAHILRHQMYFVDYGDEKRAMTDYARLSSPALPCLDCARQSCNAACGHGLPVAAKLQAAHRTLTMA